MTLQLPRQWAGKIWPTRSSSQSVRLSGLLTALRMSSHRLCRHLNGLCMCYEVTCDSEFVKFVWGLFYHFPTNLTDVWLLCKSRAAQRNHPTVMAIFWYSHFFVIGTNCVFVRSVLFGSTWRVLFRGGLYIGNMPQHSEISQEILDCLTTALSRNVGKHLQGCR
jgi:hypothetical protein